MKAGKFIFGNSFICLMSDRAARLAALRAKANRAAPTPAAQGSDEEQKSSKVKWRNYTAIAVEGEGEGGGDNGDGGKAENVEEKPTKRQRTDDDLGAPVDVVAAALAEARANRPANSGGDPLDLAPKKINWDLKRDVAARLAKLEKRTQKALVTMLRERIEKEAEDGLD